MGHIYMLTAPSGKRYIGQTRGSVESRFRQHCWNSGADTGIHRAIMYYGAEAIRVETLLTVEDSLLDYYERRFIDAYGTFERWGYNGTRGGDVNPMHDDEVRAKCVSTHAKPEVKAKHKKAMSNAMSDPDRRSRISKTLKKTLSTPEAKAQRSEQVSDSWNKNRTQRAANVKKGLANPESRAKHVEALQRIGKDPEVQKKKSEALKAAWARRKAALPPPRG